jgi:hypothetical protein
MMTFQRLISLFVAVAMTTGTFAFSYRGGRPAGNDRSCSYQQQAITPTSLDVGGANRPSAAARITRLTTNALKIIERFVRT